jgi:hypothetical protein
MAMLVYQWIRIGATLSSSWQDSVSGTRCFYRLVIQSIWAFMFPNIEIWFQTYKNFALTDNCVYLSVEGSEGLPNILSSYWQILSPSIIAPKYWKTSSRATVSSVLSNESTLPVIISSLWRLLNDFHQSRGNALSVPVRFLNKSCAEHRTAMGVTQSRSIWDCWIQVTTWPSFSMVSSTMGLEKSFFGFVTDWSCAWAVLTDWIVSYVIV